MAMISLVMMGRTGSRAIASIIAIFVDSSVERTQMYRPCRPRSRSVSLIAFSSSSASGSQATEIRDTAEADRCCSPDRLPPGFFTSQNAFIASTSAAGGVRVRSTKRNSG